MQLNHQFLCSHTFSVEQNHITWLECISVLVISCPFPADIALLLLFPILGNAVDFFSVLTNVQACNLFDTFTKRYLYAVMDGNRNP